MLIVAVNTLTLVLALISTIISFLVYSKTKQKIYFWFFIVLVYAVVLRSVLVLDWYSSCEHAKIISELMIVFWFGLTSVLVLLYKEIKDVMSGK